MTICCLQDFLGPKNERRVLLIRQDFRAEPNPFGCGDANTPDLYTDPTSYSIIDKLENYRRADGMFHFHVCYPSKDSEYKASVSHACRH